MKPIDEMTPEEKSVLLAKLCGWHVEQAGGDVWVSNSEDDYLFKIRLSSPSYLYNYKWMFLAWRVLNWAVQWMKSDEAMGKILRWYYAIDDEIRWDKSPADAQRLWLDKILQLAIEAGLCEDTAV